MESKKTNRTKAILLDFQSAENIKLVILITFFEVNFSLEPLTSEISAAGKTLPFSFLSMFSYFRAISKVPAGKQSRAVSDGSQLKDSIFYIPAGSQSEGSIFWTKPRDFGAKD